MLDVRLKADAAAPVVFQIPAAAEIYAKSGTEPFAEAKLHGVDPPPPSTFFVVRTKLIAP